MLFLVLVHGGKAGNDFIKHITNAEPLLRRDADRRADAEGVKIINALLKFRMIDLIDDEHNGLLTAAKHIGDLFVGSGYAGSAVNDENNDIRSLDCKLRLTAHLLCDYILAFGLDSARINECEFIVKPFSIGIDPVTGHAGGILNYRYALSDYFIKQGRFADIRATHYCYQGFHFISIPPKAQLNRL